MPARDSCGTCEGCKVIVRVRYAYVKLSLCDADFYESLPIAARLEVTSRPLLDDILWSPFCSSRLCRSEYWPTSLPSSCEETRATQPASLRPVNASPMH